MADEKAALSACPALHLENQLCFSLYRLSRMVTQSYTPLLKPLDITYPQYLVLLVLWRNEEDGLTSMSVSQLTRALQLDTGTVTPLLKRMEDSRGKFFVFVAGYPDNMESFLKANPGLNSRFDKILKFEDYSPKDLNQIAMLMLDDVTVPVVLAASSATVAKSVLTTIAIASAAALWVSRIWQDKVCGGASPYVASRPDAARVTSEVGRNKGV